MFALLRGQGGIFRRLLGELVPLTVGAAGGWLVGALHGALAGAGVGLGLWLVCSGLLTFVRRRPRLRRLYRLGLVAHVLFWSVQGFLGSGLAPPGPLPAPVSSRWEGAQAFRAGVAEASFELTESGTLSGWGQRPRRVGAPACLGLGPLGRLSLQLMAAPGRDGVPTAPLFARPVEPGDALGARALVLLPAGGAAPLVFVRLDLTTSDAFLFEALLRRLDDLGVSAPFLIVTATHTHSGLGGYARDPLAQVLALDHFDPVVFEGIVNAAASAVREAFRKARPARLAFGEARDRGRDGLPILARRRGTGSFDDVDDRVVGLRVEADEGRTLALLLNHAVHPVSVRRDHQAFDRDLAGAIEEQLGWRLPGHPLVLFVNGALGDVAPRVVRTPETPRALTEAGERFADAVAPDLLAAPLFDRLEVRAARLERDLGSPWTFASLGDRATYLDGATRSPFDGPATGVAADLLLLPVNAAVWSLGLSELRVAGSLSGALGVQINLERGLARATQAAGALLLLASDSQGTGRARLPLLWAPCEPSTSLGRAWRKAFASEGDVTPMVLGLANGSMAYAVSAAEHRTDSYEASATLYGPETETLLTECLRAAVDALQD